MPIKFIILFYLSITSLICQGEVNPEDPYQDYWEENIRPLYFPEQNIISDDNEILKLEAPYRAEDSSVVPILIKTSLPTNKNISIKKIYVFIDKNPSPLVGIFEFSKLSNKADLSMRVRVNEYSYIRALAETSDGKIYMAKSFVKASGGCSMPSSVEIDSKLIGSMQTRLMGKLNLLEPNLIQLKIKHPNYSGLEEANPNNIISPKQNYIKKIRAKLNGEQVLNADLTFSISANPSFRFYINPQKEGLLEIEALDTDNNIFTHTHVIDHNNVSIATPTNNK